MSKKLSIEIGDEVYDKFQKASVQIGKALTVPINVPVVSLVQITLEAAAEKETATGIAKKFVKSLTKTAWDDEDDADADKPPAPTK